MIFVRDKGQMCNNIFQFANAYAFAREHGRSVMSMRFAYKYQYFRICNTKWHNFTTYLAGKWLSRWRLIPTISYDQEFNPVSYFELEKRILGTHNSMVEGWGVRYLDLLFRYLDEIRDLFAFNRETEDAVINFLSQNGTEGAVRIGVHIRRGDYKTWNNGRFYFLDEEFIHTVRSLMSLLPNRKIEVYICGNDPNLNHEVYLNSLSGVKVYFPNGNPGEDLCLLSKCDYLVGPPSSFSLIATMYGKALLYWMGAGEPMSLDAFHDFMYWSYRVDVIMSNTMETALHRPSRLLFLISRFLDGGIDTVLIEYLNWLCRNTEHSITLAIALNHEELEVFRSKLDEKINVKYLINYRALTWYKIYARLHPRHFLFSLTDEVFLNPIRRMFIRFNLRKLLRKNDVVIDFDCCHGSFLKKVPNGIKRICYYHFSLKENEARDKRRTKTLKRKFDVYDNIALISDAMLDEAKRMFPQFTDKFFRIYNAVDDNIIHRLAEEPVDATLTERPYMLAVERLEESQKDLTTLIHAYKELSVDPSIPYLYIIGSGKDKSRLQKLIDTLGLHDRVLLLGFHKNTAAWMAKAQLVVHSSKFEGLPTVLIEALMLDKPIVASDCPTGPREILDGGKAGLLVESGNPHAMALAIRQVLDDEVLCQTMQEAARRHRVNFLPQTIMSQFEEILSK